MQQRSILVTLALIITVGLCAGAIAWTRPSGASDLAGDLTPELLRTRVLHGAERMEDDVLCSWNVVISEPLRDPATSEWRCVVVATVDYHIGLQHFGQTTLFRTLDPRSSEEITSTLTIHPSSVNEELDDRLIHVAIGPVRGTPWLQVGDGEQIIVLPTVIERLSQNR